jgi:hypothetical protein
MQRYKKYEAMGCGTVNTRGRMMMNTAVSSDISPHNVADIHRSFCGHLPHPTLGYKQSCIGKRNCDAPDLGGGAGYGTAWMGSGLVIGERDMQHHLEFYPRRQ